MTKQECLSFLKTIGDIDEIAPLAIVCGSDEGRQELIDFIKTNKLTCFGIWTSDDDTPYKNYLTITDKAWSIGKRFGARRLS